MKRLIALMLLACFSSGTLTACNTMAGAGKDVQKVGERSSRRPRTARTPTADLPASVERISMGTDRRKPVRFFALALCPFSHVQ
jgi:predicted small secreted protein